MRSILDIQTTCIIIKDDVLLFRFANGRNHSKLHTLDELVKLLSSYATEGNGKQISGMFETEDTLSNFLNYVYSGKFYNDLKRINGEYPKLYVLNVLDEIHKTLSALSFESTDTHSDTYHPTSLTKK